MKRYSLLLFMMIVAVLSVSAAKNFDLHLKRASIEKAIAEIKAKTGYDFVYQKNVVSGAEPVTCDYKGITLNQALNRIFDDRDIDYEIVDKTVILSKAKKNTPYYKRTVSGIVMNSQGEPLPGATILVENTKNGTSTDLDGMFSVIVEKGNTKLRVSYVGMKTKVVDVGNKNKVVNITLDEDAQLMSEVIVTGYTNMKRESATGSYQTIDAEQLSKRHMSSIVDNLEGLIPGFVSYNAGDGKQMTIRGAGTFSANAQPLIVVDGLPIEGSLESVNMYDIANMTVLKDAAAAAIYGARASNGVIVITTKRAKDENTVVDFNADVTLHNNNDYGYMGMINAAELIELEKYNFDYTVSGKNPAAKSTLSSYYDAGRFRAISPATRLMYENYIGKLSDADLASKLNAMSKINYLRDWQKGLEQNRFEQQYNLAIRTKGKSLSSNVGVNYAYDNGASKVNDNNTLRLSYTGIWKALPMLDFNFGINVINERTKTDNARSLSGATSFLPYISIYNPDGTLANMETILPLDNPILNNPVYGLKSMDFNPITEMGKSLSKSRRTNIRSYIHANATILPGWTASAQFQYEDIYYKNDSHTPEDAYNMRSMYNMYTILDKVTGKPVHYLPNGGMLATTTSEGAFYTFRAQTQYDHLIADKHDLQVAGGFEFREQKENTYANVLLGYDDQTQTNSNYMINWENLKNLAGSASIFGPDYPMYGAPDGGSFSTSDILHRFYSLYATANYVYDTRYTLSGSLRIDKTDLFGADPKFRGRPLWSAGASWNIHNEAFMSDVTWLQALKLRASYGLTGNIANNVSSFLTATIDLNGIYGNKFATLDTPPNDQLRWEKTATWNIGADFAVLNSRLSGALDFYLKKGSDILSSTDLDPTTGWNYLTINNGEMTNRGVELQLQGNIIEAKNRDQFGLTSGLVLSYNENKVTNVNHAASSGYSSLNTSYVHLGYPIHSLFSYKSAGLKVVDGTQYHVWVDKDGNEHASDISSEDFTPADVVYSGSLDPIFTASLVPTLTWKGFSLSAMMAYYGGHVMRVNAIEQTTDGSALGYYGLATTDFVPRAYLDYWRSGDVTKYPANGAAGGSKVIGDPGYSSANVAPADFMKIRNIVFGYEFSDKICRTLHVNNLSLRAQINNVFTCASNKFGIDPEANNPVNGNRTLRAPMSYTFSLYFNF